MRLNEARRDLYRRLAREQGYKSRAAFKLLEANERYGFLLPGRTVVDFGSAPGGWLQVASELVGPGGFVVGFDVSSVRLKDKNVTALKMDVNDPGVQAKVLALTKGRVDVVLSDLAPSVSGVWELDQNRQIEMTLRVLELCGGLLKERGSAFFKLFEGERAQEVRDRFNGAFGSVRVLKPAASRSASSELYYFCEGPREAGPDEQG